MKAIKNNDDKKKLGAKKKRERQKKKAVLAPLKGKVVDNKLSNKDVTKLLQVICLELGITDEDHVIQ